MLNMVTLLLFTLWHHGIAGDLGLLGMSRNDVTVRIDNRFENFAVILLS